MGAQDFLLEKMKDITDIFLIGKGASIDALNLAVLDAPSSLVINVNDSEHIAVGEIGVFADDWVLRFSKKTVGGCRMYVVPDDLVEMAQIIGKPILPISKFLDESGAGFHRKVRQLEEAGYERSAVVLALDLACSLAQRASRGRMLPIYLLGFDFGAGQRPSSKIKKDFSEDDEGYRRAVFDREEEIFRTIHSWSKQHAGFCLLHVGDKKYSDIFPENFNQLSEKSRVPDYSELNDRSRRIDAPQVADAQRVRIVAELTTNHCGSVDRLKEMIALAKTSGADFVKVQKRNVDTFYSRDELEEAYDSPYGTTFGDYRRKIELDSEDFQALAEACAQLEIEWFCSVLDRESFDFLRDFSPEMIKIPSTVSVHVDLLKYVAKNFNGDIVISTGYTDQSYEEEVLELFADCRSIFLLQCVSSYPARQTDTNIEVVRRYASMAERNPKIIPGYSSHDIGSLCSMLAVAAGARMVEKHVTIGNNTFLHFDHVAVRLDTSDFSDYVSDIRKAQRILGSSRKRVLKSEHHKYWVK